MDMTMRTWDEMQKTHPCRSLVEQLQQPPDPRFKGRTEHDLLDVLVIGPCCLICGGEEFNDTEIFCRAKRGWLRTLLRLRSGIPGHDAFNRVIAALKPEAFLEVFLVCGLNRCARVRARKSSP